MEMRTATNKQKSPDGNNEIIGPMEYMAQWSIWEPFDDAMGKLETLNVVMGKLWALDHESVSIGLIGLHCTLSNLWAPNFNWWKILHFIQAETEYTGPQFPIVRLMFQRLCDDYQFLILVLGPHWSHIFCHLLWLMGIYQVGPPRGLVQVFEKFRSLFLSSFSFLSFHLLLIFFFEFYSFLFLFFSFLFVFSFSFLFSLFFFSLSLGAPLAPGPMDIVHPCHPVATPLDIRLKMFILHVKCNFD